MAPSHRTTHGTSSTVDGVDIPGKAGDRWTALDGRRPPRPAQLAHPDHSGDATFMGRNQQTSNT
jgi:hypothetical protein